MRRLRGFIFNIMGEKCLEIKLTKNCIADCAHSGSCDVEVSKWVENLRPYLDTLPAELVANVLKPSGAWDDEELKDTEQNLHRLLWIAAGCCKDENSCWAYMEG